MKKIDYRKYSSETIQGIYNLYRKTRNINHILKIYPGSYYNEIISILTFYNLIDKINPCQLSLKDNKIMLISDTHYGSVYDNINYANYAFDFAKKENINTIIHGGDILEGNVNIKEDFIPKKQAEWFIENYPHDKDIKTYALLGNHDYFAIYESPKTHTLLKSREDVELLGFKKIYFNWHGQTVGLQHEIKKYKLCFSFNIHEDLNFRGHSHFYSVRKFDSQEHIFIPSLSDDPVPNRTSVIKDEISLKPGFLISEYFDNYIVTTHYYFDENNINRGHEHVKELIYTRK